MDLRIAELIARGAEGVMHLTDQGDPASWWDVAREVVRSIGSSAEVVPVPTAHFPRPAARPGYSVLDCSATEAVLGDALPEWREVLAGYLSA